jgi:hypothetical protein
MAQVLDLPRTTAGECRCPDPDDHDGGCLVRVLAELEAAAA